MGSAVSKEDKAIIRSRLLESGVSEVDQRLALQNALVIAKVVRFEYPSDWPDVINQVLELLRNSTSPTANRLYLPRTLLILLHIVKDLATGRLIRLRSNLQSISPEVFRVLGQIYMEKVQQWQAWLQNGGDNEGGAIESMEQSLLSIKIIRRLLIVGFEFPNRENDVQQFWAIVRNQLGELLTFATQSIPDHVKLLVEKHLMQLSKLHLEMAKTHPAAFVLLPDSLSLVKAYWSLVVKFGENFGASLPSSGKIGTDGDADDEVKTIMERLSLKGLLLIRACIKMVFNPAQTFKYRHEQEKQEVCVTNFSAIHSCVLTIVTENRSHSACQATIAARGFYPRNDGDRGHPLFCLPVQRLAPMGRRTR